MLEDGWATLKGEKDVEMIHQAYEYVVSVRSQVCDSSLPCEHSLHCEAAIVATEEPLNERVAAAASRT